MKLKNIFFCFIILMNLSDKVFCTEWKLYTDPYTGDLGYCKSFYIGLVKDVAGKQDSIVYDYVKKNYPDYREITNVYKLSNLQNRLIVSALKEWDVKSNEVYLVHMNISFYTHCVFLVVCDIRKSYLEFYGVEFDWGY